MLKIWMFGRFRVEAEGRRLTGFELHKVQELFGYLLLHPHQPHSREKLVEILWPQSPAARAGKLLSQTIWQLQGALAEHSQPCLRQGQQQPTTTQPSFSRIRQTSRSEQAANLNLPSLLLIEAEWLQLNPRAQLWVDVWEFEHAFEALTSSPAWKTTPQALKTASRFQLLKEATQLVEGILLEGCYQEWCQPYRQELQDRFLSLLDLIVEECEKRQDYLNGLVYARRSLGWDRTREVTHQQLMRLYYRANNRAAALRQYQQCVALLKEELGVEPSWRTVALYEQIWSERLDHARSENDFESAGAEEETRISTETPSFDAAMTTQTQSQRERGKEELLSPYCLQEPDPQLDYSQLAKAALGQLEWATTISSTSSAYSSGSGSNSVEPLSTLSLLQVRHQLLKLHASLHTLEQQLQLNLQMVEETLLSKQPALRQGRSAQDKFEGG